MRPRKQREPEQPAERVEHSLAAWREREGERLMRELGEQDNRDARESRDAKDAGSYVDPGLSGTFYRAWLYSGSAAGEEFGPPQPGHLKCRESRTAARRDHRADEEIDRERIFIATFRALPPVDQQILTLYLRAQFKPGVVWWAVWVAEQLRASSLLTVRGTEWTAESVRRRVTRINERLAQAVAAGDR